MSAVVLGHAFLGVAMLLARGRSRATQARIGGFAAAAGGVLSLIVFLWRDSGEWRTLAVDAEAATLAGFATACAWLLTGVLDLGEDRWRAGALVGAGSTAFTMFAANEWFVPALLFWTITSLACAALAAHRPERHLLWVTLFASDVLVVVSFLGHYWDAETWTMPDSVSGWPLWTLVAAAILRAGVFPGAGIWGAIGRGGAPCIPLIVGGAFALAGLGSGGRPWATLGLLVLAGSVALWSTLGRLRMATVAAWPVAFSLGLSFVSPALAAGAGVAALLGITGILLWPEAVGRAQLVRAALVSFVPVTIGFGLVVEAATRAFERATDFEELSDALPWTLIAAALPGALAAGVALGSRLARQQRSDLFGSPAVVASWAIGAVAVVLGVVPAVAAGLGGTPLGPVSKAGALNGAALIGGLFAAFAMRREGPDGTEVDVGVETGAVYPSKRIGLALDLFALLLALACAVGVGWITVEGLKLGFL